MLIFLYGSDTFRAKEKLDELKKRFLEKNNGNSFLISEIDGAEFNIAEFRNKVLSSGFFAEKKMVILKNFLSAKNKQDAEVLEIIKKVSEENILIAWERGDEAGFEKSELFKFLAGQKFTFKFNALSGNDLIKWIRERAKMYGAEIDNEAILEICDILGGDLCKIDLELQKICAFAGPGGKINAGTVAKLLSKEAEDNIFKFIDALAAKNKRMAMLSLEEELRAGVSELQILGIVAGQIRNLIQTKALLETGGISKEELAKKISVHPYVAQKSLSQARNFQMNELKNIYRQLLAIDMGIKTSSASPRAMFGRMIAKI